MKQKIIDLVAGPIKTSTFRQSVQTFSATFVNGLLGAVFYILAARYLGPSDFGTLTVAIAVLTLVSDIGDVGTDTGLVNFVSRNLKDHPEIAKKYLKLSLKIKIFMWMAISLIGILISKAIAVYIFKKPELTPYLRIAFVGTGSLLVFSFTTHALQAYQKFLQWGVIQVVFNLLRLGAMLVIFYLFTITVGNTLWLYIAIPVLGFLAGLKLIPNFLREKGENKFLGEFLRYNKWVAIFTALSAIAAKADTFLAARLLSSYQLGLYAAAGQLVKIIPQFVTALGTVIAPKMATLKNNSELLVYLRKTISLVGLIVALGLSAIPVVLYFIPLMFGSEYLGSIPIFIVLYTAMLIFLFSVPLHMAVIYYFSHPKLFMYLAMFSLINILTVGYLLLKNFGAVGAAYSVLINQIVGLAVPGFWVMKAVRDKK